jgi:FMN phosphatase YigB (HAD superfamily)
MSVMFKAVCFDLGDTLVAEETVIHDSSGRAISAEVIKGAFEILKKLAKAKYKIALIANDEDAAGTRNIIIKTGLKEYFNTTVISGEVGVEKPDSKIFYVALNNLGVKAEDAVMVGNRIDVDIVGANRIGMTSVWLKWNNRYPASMDSCEEKPDFTIFHLLELNEVLGFS